MSLELTFSRRETTTPWGFRLVGGSDFNQPLVVVKVNENSVAEECGLMVGDVVVMVNDTPTIGLTHKEFHDLLQNAGDDFIVAIKRGLFSDIPILPEDENESNSEIEEILKDCITQDFRDTTKDQDIGQSPKILENLAGQEQTDFVPEPKVNKNECSNKPKKWSTFLVKPKNPKPTPKKVQEERKIIGEPYQVKIVKQQRRDPFDILNHKKTVQFDSKVTEVEISCESSVADSNETSEIPIINDDEDMEIETSVQIIDETVVEIQDADENDQISEADNDSLENHIIEKDDEVTIIKSKPILKPKPLDIHIDPVICESSLTLEEQLAAVQKQLLALSQLPSAIQVTLEAVTQQLNKIVLEKSVTVEEYNHENNDIEVNENTEVSEREEIRSNEAQEDASLSENAEGDITENEIEENHNFDEFEEDGNIDYENNSNVEEEIQNVETNNVNESIKNDPYAGLTEEEKEAQIREEQLLAKKEKEEERKRKMDWAQRPIILPGGRKWSDPDDATPKIRKLKMSDEKISKTIEDCSEVIVGKTKGINFLKYQPPPKNLDYLQKSEVYRLIHGMEPPIRGVGARAEKILSEKDYYETKGAP